MTVGELKKLLEKFDESLDVKYYTGDDGYGDVDVKDAYVDEYGYVCIF